RRVKASAKSDLFRKLPAVDELMRLERIAALANREGHAAVAEAARTVLASLRRQIAQKTLDAARLELALSTDALAGAVERELRRALAPALRNVINATGVVLHTNLGRAPLASAAAEHISATATRFTNLEFDLATGVGKDVATVVVNNNAAAVLLALNTLGEGGEVVVSRGELVEIGGSFRIPEIMAKSGAVLREVGATNRTRLADYERAIGERTRLLLRVHRSNFQIVG